MKKLFFVFFAMLSFAGTNDLVQAKGIKCVDNATKPAVLLHHNTGTYMIEASYNLATNKIISVSVSDENGNLINQFPSYSYASVTAVSGGYNITGFIISYPSSSGTVTINASGMYTL